MSSSKIEAWIKMGYQLLGAEGMEGMKIERLARKLKLNKSGFYYYFGSMQCFLGKLLDQHVRVARTISAEVGACANVDPDVLLLIVRHRDFFLVESHLLFEAKTSPFEGNFEEAGNIVLKDLLNLWRRTGVLPIDQAAALAYLNIIRHFFYARIDQDHIDYEYLHTLIADTKEVLVKVMVRPVASLSHVNPSVL